MRLGWCGLGKLGAPIAEHLAASGHGVLGYDTDPAVEERLERVQWCATLPEMARRLPLIFVAVPTPHGPEHEGVTRAPETRADFDYTALHQVLSVIDEHAPANTQRVTVVVVSTCLPGTWRREFAQYRGFTFVHSPSFVGMGQVVEDFSRPEFWLIGTPNRSRCPDLEALYRTVNPDAPFVRTDVTTAEAIKVAYNTWVSAKITLANFWGETADRLGIDADEITRALGLATRRIVSSAYMRAGMGDGGPCHPRDLIALSWLVDDLGGSYDLPGAFMAAREAHTEWLASLVPDGAVLFGGPFKPGTELTTGSPALLLAAILTEQGKSYTMGLDPEPGAVNVIVTAEPRYAQIQWPEGSIVVDVFGLIPDQPGVEVRRPGRRIG